MDLKESLHSLEDWLDNAKPRTFDKFLLGPFLVWYGLQYRKTPKLARRLLITAGIWQIFYSWKHYRELPHNLSELPKLVNSAISNAGPIISEAEAV